MTAGLLLSLLLFIGISAEPAAAPGGALQGRHVLIFSHTTGYRHASIEQAVPALTTMIAAAGGEATASEDPSIFSAQSLEGIDAIVLVSTTTDRRRPESEWLTGSRRDALQAFVRSGGGIVGIHAASDSHEHWPWYGEMLGGRFERHPPGTVEGRLRVVDSAHPATAGLPREIAHVDEWYFIRDYQPGSRLLLALDLASIGEAGSAAGPISWAREHEGGRIFYTSLGHTPESWSQPFFIDHLRGGLRWVTARERP